MGNRGTRRGDGRWVRSSAAARASPDGPGPRSPAAAECRADDTGKAGRDYSLWIAVIAVMIIVLIAIIALQGRFLAGRPPAGRVGREGEEKARERDDIEPQVDVKDDVSDVGDDGAVSGDEEVGEVKVPLVENTPQDDD